MDPVLNMGRWLFVLAPAAEESLDEALHFWTSALFGVLSLPVRLAGASLVGLVLCAHLLYVVYVSGAALPMTGTALITCTATSAVFGGHDVASLPCPRGVLRI
jgi:hypothetical protein